VFEYRVLGPLEVARGGEPVRFRGSRERALLALLVVNANRIVSSERVAEELWNGHPPEGALKAVRVYVSRIRQALGDSGEVLSTRPSGYQLQADASAIDACRFEALVAKGREQARAGDHGAAAASLREAQAHWRGPALADVVGAPFAEAEAARLEEARLAALEDLMDAELACGRHVDLTSELDASTRANPFRERFWAQRILALYRSGRQADALRAYQKLRDALREQLGIEPSEALRRLEGAVLRHDPDLDWRPPLQPGQLPFPLGRHERVRLVGRARELARLETAWQAHDTGQRRLVLLGGEPGIGKSRLLTEFARQVHAAGAVVLFGRCDEGMGVPYQPFVEALTRYMRDAPSPTGGRLAGELVRLVPEISERIPDLPPPLQSDPETERYRLFEAVAAWLAAVSENTPVLFAIDDLHWATRPTLLLLSHLVRSEGHPLPLLLAAYRDNPLDMTSDLAGAVAELLQQPGVERIALSGLDQAGVATLMEAQARHGLDEDGRALARVLHAETAGNPFFLREMLRHLAEKGALVQRDGRWVTRQAVTEVDVPDSVREVVGRRLTRLPERTDEVLAAAAVLGERFELPVLAAAVGDSESSVLSALRPAAAARLVVETAVGRYHFAHALVRATLEDALGPTRRAQLHLRAAEAIEAVFAGRMKGRSAALAKHYEKAGSAAPPGRAAEAFVDAGREAVQALAWEEAAVYWRAALALMETDGPAQAQADLLRRLADLMFVTGLDLPSGVAYGERALGLYQELGDRKWPARMHSRLGRDLCIFVEVMNIPKALEHLAAAEAGLSEEGDSPALAYVYVSFAAARQWTVQWKEGLVAARRALEMARRLDRPAIEALASVVLGWHLFASGALTEARSTLADAWQIADRLDHSAAGFHSARVLGQVHVHSFDPAEARRVLQRELAQPRQVQAPNHRRILDALLAWAHAVAGRLAEAQAALERAKGVGQGVVHAPPLGFWRGEWEDVVESLGPVRDRCLEVGNIVEASGLDRWRAEAARLAGYHSQAADLRRSALALHPSAPFGGLLRLDAALADFEAGRTAQGRDHLRAAGNLVAATEDWRGIAGRLALAEAMGEASVGNLVAGANAFERAITVLRRFQLPWEEAEAFLFWGQALARAGKRSQADEHLNAANALYDRIDAAPRWRDRVNKVRSQGLKT
jgi:DNA-binding SARP family transcriptional activator